MTDVASTDVRVRELAEAFGDLTLHAVAVGDARTAYMTARWAAHFGRDIGAPPAFVVEALLGGVRAHLDAIETARAEVVLAFRRGHDAGVDQKRGQS
jgi:hypothetical protein